MWVFLALLRLLFLHTGFPLSLINGEMSLSTSAYNHQKKNCRTYIFAYEDLSTRLEKKKVPFRFPLISNRSDRHNVPTFPKGLNSQN